MACICSRISRDERRRRYKTCRADEFHAADNIYKLITTPHRINPPTLPSFTICWRYVSNKKTAWSSSELLSTSMVLFSSLKILFTRGQELESL